MWRYFRPDRLIDLLTTGELFFSSIAGLSDGLEGVLPVATREQLVNERLSLGETLDSANESVNQFQRHRDQFFVNCWSMNECESYLIWEAYTARGCGYAIETPHADLAAAFESFNGVIDGNTITYIPHSSETLRLPRIGNVFTAITHKDLAYRDEREFRLIFWSADPANASVPTTPNGVRVQVDLGRLISRIHLRPKGTDSADDAQKIATLAATRGLSCTFHATGIVDT